MVFFLPQIIRFSRGGGELGIGWASKEKEREREKEREKERETEREKEREKERERDREREDTIQSLVYLHCELW